MKKAVDELFGCPARCRRNPISYSEQTSASRSLQKCAFFCLLLWSELVFDSGDYVNITTNVLALSNPPKVLLGSKYLPRTKQNCVSHQIKKKKGDKNRALNAKLTLVWKLVPAVSIWASGSSKLTRQTCSRDSIKSHQYCVISPLVHASFGIYHTCNTNLYGKCSNCMCCRVPRGFSTTVSNRPCRVSWVCRIYLTVKKFWFSHHVVKNAWHIQLPESEPWNAKKRFGNQRLQKWLCLDDRAKMWFRSFCEQVSWSDFLLNKK